MSVPHVILIGGAPRTGKGTLARALAARLGHDLVATDDLGVAARAVTTPESHPDLHPMAGVDYREYYIARSDDVLWHEAVAAHRALWPAVESLVRGRTDWGRPAIVEGWAVLPELVQRSAFVRTFACWLVAEGSTLEQRTRSATGFYRGASDEEALIAKFTARSLRYNDVVQRAAHESGADVFHLAADEPMDALVERVLSVAAKRLG